MTIEEVMRLVRDYGHEVALKGVAESDHSDVRAALVALVAQARVEAVIDEHTAIADAFNATVHARIVERAEGGRHDG